LQPGGLTHKRLTSTTTETTPLQTPGLQPNVEKLAWFVNAERESCGPASTLKAPSLARPQRTEA